MEKRINKIERKDRTRGQMRLLQIFYKELNSWEAASVGARMASGLMLFVGTPLLWIPWQEQESGHLESVMFVQITLLMCLGIFMYLWPYLYFQEFYGEKGDNRRHTRVVKILQYLPVDKRSILLFLLGKLFRMILILGVIQLAGQCLAAWLSYGKLITGNFLYPVILGMLLPAGVNALTVVMEVRGM